MAENKTRPTGADVDAFLDAVEHDRQRAEGHVLRALLEEVVGEPAVLWGPSIVGCGAYHYVYDSGREGDMCLAGFSPRKGKHSIYVLAGFDDRPDLMARLGKHKVGKGCLYVNKLDDIDLDVLRELVAWSVSTLRERYGA